MNKSLNLAVMGTLCAITAPGGPKKYIGHGWDTLGVTPTEIAKNLNELDETGLDGITIVIQKKSASGGNLNSLHITTDPLWTKQDMADQIPILRQISARKNLKHCFLASMWSPAKRIDWEDDQAWARFSNNIGVLAWLAKQGNMKGILADPEDYGSVSQFIRKSNEAPFEKLAQIARKRGAQVFTSMFKEYPDLTFFSFFLFYFDTSYVNSVNPLESMRHKGDLWPSFFNGMLDAIPPTARILDGNEHAYRFEAGKRDFYYSSWCQQNGVLPLIAPENRDKYRMRLLVGFGLYLDMYTNTDPKGTYYFGPISGSRLTHFSQNLAQATQVATEYIWLYGESYSFIPWKNISNKKYETQGTWNDKLPGFTKTLFMTKDPQAFLADELKRKDLKNIVQNGDCTPTEKFTTKGFQKDKYPKPFTVWQHEQKRQGAFGIDNSCGEGDTSSLCAVGVEHGCFCLSTHVKSGERFMFESSAKGENISYTVSWMGKGRWQWQVPSIDFPVDKGTKDQWRKARGIITVPGGVDEMVILLGIKQKPEEKSWFDNIHLYRMEFN